MCKLLSGLFVSAILIGTTVEASLDSTKACALLAHSESLNSTATCGSLEEIGQRHGYFAFYKTGLTEFLGNFANCPNGIEYAGHKFQNSEAAFQWTKFQLAALHHQNDEMMSDPEMDQFFDASGEEAFEFRQKFDRKYKGIYPKEWQNGLRDQVMWQVLEHKFQQNSDFANYLNRTAPFYLLEHNEREGRDTYWSDDATGHGLNMLGKMLMAIRDGTPCPIPYDDSDRLERIYYAQNFDSKTPYSIF